MKCWVFEIFGPFFAARLYEPCNILFASDSMAKC